MVGMLLKNKNGLIHMLVFYLPDVAKKKKQQDAWDNIEPVIDKMKELCQEDATVYNLVYNLSPALCSEDGFENIHNGVARGTDSAIELALEIPIIAIT
jgi:hypothetical protein